ncbi:MAG: acyloxyacyl hydrolase [Flavisolibacter sp.]|nr:acyloxyacyl hydrolase [Flavisolibacter sp.]
MRLRLNLFLIALIFFTAAEAQDTTEGFFKYSSFGLQFNEGTAIGVTYNRIRDSRPFSGEIYYQRQINPGPVWNNTKRLPQWGLGLSATHSGSKYVGAIVSLYPFIKVPLYTIGSLQSDLRFGFGLAWVEKPYDKETNTEDLLLSQKFNTHASLQWQNELRLSSKHFINTAVNFYHSSNAKTSLPNLGINIPSLSVGYRYAFNGETKKPVYANDTLNKKIFYKVFLTGGVKQMQVPDSSHYFVKILSGEMSKQIGYSSIVSLGTFITHDASVKTDTLVKHLGSIKTSQVALYGSYEYKFGRITIPVQFGVFLYNSNSKLMEAVGIRYKLSGNWMAEFLLKAHGHKADLMHAGIGYVFR